MTTKKAFEILANHNIWRLGADIVPTNPKELTQSIVVALKVLKKQIYIEEQMKITKSIIKKSKIK